MKLLLLSTIAGSFMLAGACIAAGFLNHIDSSESLVLTLVSLLLAAFGLLEYQSMPEEF